MGGGISKDDLKKNPAGVAKIEPMRPIPEPNPELHKITVPLCTPLPDENTIDLYSQGKKKFDYNGLFSFVLYYNDDFKTFIDSPYYIGISIYAEFVHEHDFFRNTAIIIYTDTATLPLLSKTFSAYPKIIFAVVNCKRYAIDDIIESSIMRCFRFQALELFPRSWICIRDADTLFTSELMNAHEAYSNGWGGTTPDGIAIPDYRLFFVDRISKWEEDFIHHWMMEGSPITLGTHSNYRASWHTEFPFIYPLKRVIKAAEKMHYGPGGSTVNLTTELGGRFENYETETGVKLFNDTVPMGVYAGFTNFNVRRAQNIWLLCYDYLIRHYEIILDGRPKISDEYMAFSASFGKDERMILFAILPYYLSDCYFFSVEYYGSIQLFNNIVNKVHSESLKFIELIKLPQVPLQDVKLMDKKATEVKIFSILLRSDYISYIYENSARYSTNFMSQFSDFYKKYTRWLADFMNIPEENIHKHLETVIKKERKRDLVNNYVGLNITNFISAPRRIARPSKQVEETGRARANAATAENFNFLDEAIPPRSATTSTNHEGGYRSTRHKKMAKTAAKRKTTRRRNPSESKRKLRS
jgi:hypothetical protein